MQHTGGREPSAHSGGAARLTGRDITRSSSTPRHRALFMFSGTAAFVSSRCGGFRELGMAWAIIACSPPAASRHRWGRLFSDRLRHAHLEGGHPVGRTATAFISSPRGAATRTRAAMAPGGHTWAGSSPVRRNNTMIHAPSLCADQ